MGEEDLEVLVTLDDPGEDDLEADDTFHNRQTEDPSNISNNEATRTAKK